MVILIINIMKIRRINPIFVAAIALSLTITSCYNDNEEDLYLGGDVCDTTNVTYTNSVAPVFAANCNSCHNAASPAGGIATDTYADVKNNYESIRSAINRTDGTAMPKGGNKLTSCELKKIDVWINQGMLNN